MYKRKDGRWEERVTMPNGKRVCFYGKTKSEVLRKLADYEEKQETGEKFEDVAEAWWEDIESNIAHNTAKGYLPAKNRAISRFCGTPIKSITPAQISAHIKEFARTHADKTVRTQLMVYNLIFKYAVANDYVLINAARDLSIPNNLKKTKRKPPSSEDIQRVKDSTECTLGMVAYWAMYTGLRRGELLALRWEDVDPIKRTININKAIYYHNNIPVLKSTKTEASTAAIPILDALFNKVKFKKKGIIFHNEKGEYYKESEFRSLWNIYCKESGITATLHQFRHCFATMLFEAGIPPQEAQVLLRHAQISTTMDIYTDIRENKRQDIFNKVSSIDIN